MNEGPDDKMTLDEYQRWVGSKWGIPPDASSERHMTAAALALAGEAGEIADLLKKAWFGNRHGPDPLVLRKQLGDVLFYLAGMCNVSGDGLQTVMEENVRRLNERDPDGLKS